MDSFRDEPKLQSSKALQLYPTPPPTLRYILADPKSDATMADILTQIQDELDMVRNSLDARSSPANSAQLLHQMASVLSVIRDRAPPSPIPGQPVHPSLNEQDGQTQTSSNPTQTTTQQSGSTQTVGASAQQSQQSFSEDLKELSRDLVLKEQQIELLISRLPGIGTSQKEQMERMKEVERQLEDIEGERNEAVKERAVLLEKVENLIGGIGGMG